MPRQIANEQAIFADNAVRRVFDFVVAHNPCLDDAIAVHVDLDPVRVVAILGSLKQLGLVEINDDNGRGIRSVRVTRQGITLARGLDRR